MSNSFDSPFVHFSDNFGYLFLQSTEPLLPFGCTPGDARQFGTANFGKTGILIAFVFLVNVVMLIIRVIVGIIQLVAWLWKQVSKIFNALPIAGLLGI